MPITPSTLMIHMITCYFQLVKDLLWMQIHVIPSLMDQIRIKGKAIPVQAWVSPEGSRRLRVPDFEIISTQRWLRLSSLLTSRLYPPGIISGTHFCSRLHQPQGHRADGRIMSMKNLKFRESNLRPSGLLRSASTTAPLRAPHTHFSNC